MKNETIKTDTEYDAEYVEYIKHLTYVTITNEIGKELLIQIDGEKAFICYFYYFFGIIITTYIITYF